MQPLSRKDIIKSRPVHVVPVRTAQGTLLIREMSGVEGARFDAAFDASRDGGKRKDGVKGPPIKAVLFCLSVCDESGKLLFGEDEAAVVARDVPLSLIQAVYAAAIKLNGYTDEAQEDDAKNSEAASANGSSSNSRLPGAATGKESSGASAPAASTGS